MYLKDILTIFSRRLKPLGYTQEDIYRILFESDEQTDLYQIAKNTFSNRPLSQYISHEIYSDVGFLELCQTIEKEFLGKLGDHEEIFGELCLLIEEDHFLGENEKQTLIGSCDPKQTQQLARLTAISILCGNYNTSQNKKKKEDSTTAYGLNVKKIISIDYNNFLEYDLWKRSQFAFNDSRSAGKRFHYDIIRNLLPKGYISDYMFKTRGKTDDGTIHSLIDLCMNCIDDILVIGDGGIGKTTFLQQLMQDEFLTDSGNLRRYKTGRPVPFFIELNRCPDHIGSWYDDSLKKTNFITRYVGQIYENHSSLDSISATLLDDIEKEFQKIPEDGHPRYLLLLDGFNEVKTSKGQSVRTYLSNEISVLHGYPNVRIITTSRETQAAYFASEFRNIRLVGLETDDIIEHLNRCGKNVTDIGMVMACKPLVECLRNPLYLCMFSAKDDTDAFLPETPGEILYCFFHRNSAFYNTRQRASDTRSNPLNEEQTAFVLDFILPYIGWKFEMHDVFSVNNIEFEDIIHESLLTVKELMCSTQSNPFIDFNYSGKLLAQTIDSFFTKDSRFNTANIIDCIHSYLGIVYYYQINEGQFADRNRYAFSHHQFRDYFSAIWDVQLLSMLQCIEPAQFRRQNTYAGGNATFHNFLNKHYWQHHKTEFISQILMEHRNKPQLCTITYNWFLPSATYDEQKVLTNALSFCRKLYKHNEDIHYLLQNILSSILIGRKELSGLDLSDLDLKYCNFFNVTCSRKGSSNTLAAKFDGSVLYEDNFKPEDHQDNIIEFIYHENHCYTVDDYGIIKCWDVRSGKLEYQLLSGSPSGLHDYSSSGFIQISDDGKWLAAKVQNSTAKGMMLCINLYDLSKPETPPKQLFPSQSHKLLNSFSFTGDSCSLLMLCDYKHIYCFSLNENNLLYYHKYEELFKESRLYADSHTSLIFAFSAEYDLFEMDNEFMESWEYADEDFKDLEINYTSEENQKEHDFDSDDYEEDSSSIPCMLCTLDPNTGIFEILYTFTGMPQTTPTAKYIPDGSYFLFFNYTNKQIEQFFCETQSVRTVFEELTIENDMPPSAIYLHKEHQGECYLMYPDNCYIVDPNTSVGNGILMKYPVSGINKLLAQSGQESDMTFKTTVAPIKNRFIVNNDTNNYEWDVENDRLYSKYNTAYYGCTGLISDELHEYCILVHQYNGISIFGDEPLRLIDSYCFSERDYYIGNCCYESASQLLALAFARSDHEKIVLLDLKNGSQTVCFSTLQKSETIEMLGFDNSGKFLLITTQYQCLEYDIQTGKLHKVCVAGQNERLAGGDYTGNTIAVAIVEDNANEQCSVQTRCEYYHKSVFKDTVDYTCNGYYILPEIEESLLPYFIYQHGDLGVEGTHGTDGFQKYWVTPGFFLQPNNEFSMPSLEYYIKKGNQFYKKEKTLSPLEIVFIRHSKALEDRHRRGNSGSSYTYLSDDRKTALLIQDSQKLSFHNNLEQCNYSDIEAGFRMTLGSYDGHAYWDYAIPWHSNEIIGCFENYRIIRIDTKTGESFQETEYTPGVAIYGCSFRNAQMDDTTLKIVISNGGFVS